MRLAGPLRADEAGNSVVELGLVLPIMATLLMGAIDISRAVSAKTALEQAAQRTIELIQRSAYDVSDNSAYEDEAEAAAGTGSTATITNWLECNNNGTKLDYTTGSCTSGDPYARYTRVTITQPFSPMFGSRFFPGANADGTFTITAVAGIRSQ
jgi:Flp pilus assembly protein TadG